MAVNVTVDRPVRPREYLTEREIEKLIKAVGENRWGHRDATAILIAYRHGLRASELLPAMNPIIGIAGCCARAASGQPTAAPPRSVMNLRRCMCPPPGPCFLQYQS